MRHANQIGFRTTALSHPTRSRSSALKRLIESMTNHRNQAGLTVEQTRAPRTLKLAKLAAKEKSDVVAILFRNWRCPMQHQFAHHVFHGVLIQVGQIQTK